MNDKTKTQRVKEIAAELAAMFPGQRVGLDHCGTDYVRLWLFGFTTYKDASNALSALGVKTRNKQPGEHQTSLVGRVDDLIVSATCAELPPTCHLEVRKKRIPKTEVVTLNDQFIEVEERVVVCTGGDEDENAKNENL